MRKDVTSIPTNNHHNYNIWLIHCNKSDGARNNVTHFKRNEMNLHINTNIWENGEILYMYIEREIIRNRYT